MTLLIAHRGLINGSDHKLENNPDTLLHARSKGYDVELDLWYNSNNWYLGHDNPQYEIGIDWLTKINRDNYLSYHHAWIHAKNIEALYQLRKRRWEGHMFYHTNDDYTLTNTGYIWTFPGKTVTPLSISVMPENTDDFFHCRTLDVYGFCTDYVVGLEQKMNEEIS